MVPFSYTLYLITGGELPENLEGLHSKRRYTELRLVPPSALLDVEGPVSSHCFKDLLALHATNLTKNGRLFGKIQSAGFGVSWIGTQWNSATDSHMTFEDILIACSEYQDPSVIRFP